jgi:hypothetical protein
MTSPGRVLPPDVVLSDEFHSGERCDCLPAHGESAECDAWAANILRALHEAGYAVVPIGPDGVAE